MRVGNERRRRDRGGIGIVDLAVLVDIDRLAVGAHRALDADDVALPWADAVGVGFDFRQAGRRHHRAEGARVAGLGPFVGPVDRNRISHGAGLHVDAVAVDELDQLGVQALALHVFQAAGLERLDVDGRGFAVQARGVDHRDELVFQRQPHVAEPGRVLRFRVDRDGAAGFARLQLLEVEDLLEGRDLELAVELLGPLCVGRNTAQRLDFCQGEVLNEPAGLRFAVDFHRLLARGKFGMARDVGADCQVGVVPRDQHAVLGDEKVHFDDVGTQLDGARIGFHRLFREIP